MSGDSPFLLIFTLEFKTSIAENAHPLLQAAGKF